jgi:hypothetical protein
MLRSLILVLILAAATGQGGAALARTPLAPPVTGVAAGVGSHAVASDGNEFLIAWTMNQGEIWLSRIDADGRLLSTPYRLRHRGPLERLSLHWSGSEYLLAWQSGERVFVVRLDRAAHQVGEWSFESERIHGVSWSKAALLFVTEPRDGANARALLFTADGRAIHPPIPLQAFRYQVAPLPDGFALVSPSGIDRLAVDTGLVSRVTELVAQSARTIVSNREGQLLVVGTRTLISGFIHAPELVLTLVDTAGRVAAFETIPASDAHQLSTFAAAWSGDRFVVVGVRTGAAPMHQLLGLWRVRITTEGELLDRQLNELTGGEIARSGVQVTASSAGTIITYYTPFGRGLFALPLGRDLEPATAAPDSAVAVAPATLLRSTLSSAGDELFAVWTESLGDRVLVRGRRFSGHGSPLAAPVLIAEMSPFGNIDHSLAASFNGWEHLVVWSSGNRLLAKRVTRFGAVVDAEPVLLGENFSFRDDMAVVWNGAAWLVAWSEQNRILGRLVSPSLLLGEVKQLTPGTVAVPGHPHDEWHYDERPALVWTGEEFVLVWTLVRVTTCVGIPCPYTTDVVARRFGSDLNPIAPTVLIANVARNPAIATNQRDLRIAWVGGDGIWSRGFSRMLAGGEAMRHVEWPINEGGAAVTLEAIGSDFLLSWATTNGIRAGVLRLDASGEHKAAWVDADQARPLSLAVTDAREVAVIRVLERFPSSQPHEILPLRAMAPAPAPPAAPRLLNVLPRYDLPSSWEIGYRVSWEAGSSDHRGFAVELVSDGRVIYRVLVPADQLMREIHVPRSFPDYSIRVRAWNDGGFSPSSEMWRHIRRRPVSRAGEAMPAPVAAGRNDSPDAASDW